LRHPIYPPLYMPVPTMLLPLQKLQLLVLEQEEKAQAARDRLAAWQARCNEEAEADKQWAAALENVQRKKRRQAEGIEQYKQSQGEALELYKQRQAESLKQHKEQQVCGDMIRTELRFHCYCHHGLNCYRHPAYKSSMCCDLFAPYHAHPGHSRTKSPFRCNNV